MSRLVLVTVLIVAATEWFLASEQGPPRSSREGVYTTAQAAQGKIVYDEQCASCHGSMALSAPDMAPLLNDPGFQNLWSKRSLGQLFGRIKESMPQDRPGSLTPQQAVDIVAYILSANALPEGSTPLPPVLDELKEIRLDAQDP